MGKFITFVLFCFVFVFLFFCCFFFLGGGVNCPADYSGAGALREVAECCRSLQDSETRLL